MERIVITKDGRAISKTEWVDFPGAVEARCESLLPYHEAMRLIAALDTLARYGRDESGRVK